jgi:hypothetical protein
MKQTPQELIQEWQDAYAMANACPAPTMNYRNGWFRTRFNAFRRREIVALTATLRARAR